MDNTTQNTEDFYLVSKMNKHYRKFLATIGVVFATITYVSTDVFGKISNTNVYTFRDNVHSASVVTNTVALAIGLFVLYSILAALIFITLGEIFIRICEHFKINSALYRYMSNAKDVTTMNALEYHEKHNLNKPENKK